MMYNIKFTKLAHITNEYNLMFLNAFNPNFSSKIREYIIKNINSLSSFPHSHPLYKKTNANIYRKLIVKNLYHIIFIVNKNTVTILYVTDARKARDEYYPLLP